MKPHANHTDGQVTNAAMGEILALVGGYFERYGWPAAGSKILVAVSGGPDSVALVAVLERMSDSYGWELGVAHVHHGLRGPEADADELFVQELATIHGFKFHGRRLDAGQRSSQENLQSWARYERYRFFDETANEFAYSHIAVAHHLDDRAESVAAAVLDAAGTFALSGIPPVRERIIRPLFNVARTMIEAMLREEGIACRIDGSNESPKYQRNRIRHEILPLWRASNPAIADGLARIGEQLWIQRRYLESQAAHVVDNALTCQDPGRLTLDMRKLAGYDAALDPFVLRELIGRIDMDVVPSPSTVSRFADLRSGRGGMGLEDVEQGCLIMRRSQNFLEVTCKPDRVQSRDQAPAVPVIPSLTTRIIARPNDVHGNDSEVARFDLDTLEGEVSVRWPEPGDRYQPFGLAGTKKLYDLLADRRVPAFERSLVPVVVDNQGILWPVGHPIAHRARLTVQTRRVLEARLQEGSWKNRS